MSLTRKLRLDENARLMEEKRNLAQKNEQLQQENQVMQQRIEELMATPENKYRALAKDLEKAITTEELVGFEKRVEQFKKEFPESTFVKEAGRLGKEARATRIRLEEDARKAEAEQQAALKRKELLEGEYVDWEDFLVMATQGIKIGKRYQFYADLELGTSPKVCDETKGYREEGYCWGSAYPVDLKMDDKELERKIILGKGILTGNIVVSMQRNGEFALHAFE